MQNWWLEKLDRIGASAETLDMFGMGDNEEDGEELYEWAERNMRQKWWCLIPLNSYAAASKLEAFSGIFIVAYQHNARFHSIWLPSITCNGKFHNWKISRSNPITSLHVTGLDRQSLLCESFPWHMSNSTNLSVESAPNPTVSQLGSATLRSYPT